MVTRLERRYAAFDGLNLTWETLEGLVKHNGPLTDRAGKPAGRFVKRGVAASILDYNLKQDLELWNWPSAEAQAAAIADDIAYDAHDIDDGLRAGLFVLDDLAVVPFIADLIGEVDDSSPGLDELHRGHEVIRRIITRMIEDVIAESQRRILEITPASADDIRNAGRQSVGLSAAMAETDRAIKGFLNPRMYRHERVMRIMTAAEEVLHSLFVRYLGWPDDLPAEWRQSLVAEEGARARQMRGFHCRDDGPFCLDRARAAV